jgi:ribosomal protein L7/L12
LIALTAGLARAQDGSPKVAPDLNGFHVAVREVVLRHYPHATTHVVGDTIHFEHDTRIFLVHHQSKTGEWEEARPERGPKAGGVHCDIHLGPGQNPSARAPGPHDMHYYVEHLYAPYSAKHDHHLRVVLRLPARGREPAPTAFIAELEKVMARFDELVVFAGTRGPAAACTVLLRNPGKASILLIKAVREVTGMGLADAKDLVDAAAGQPAKVLEGLTREKADEVRKRLEAAGGQVEIR